MSFTRLSYWVWGGKDHEAPASALNSSSEFPAGFREQDSLKFPTVSGARMRSSSRRVKRKWQSREERMIDKEYDIVLVPSDGVCMSGSESDDSDWSIGWLEPHAPDFLSDSESESSFAVLVPCYGRGRCEQTEVPKNHVLGAVEHHVLGAVENNFLRAAVELHNGFTSEGKSYIEQWLSSLQNM